ncbi:MAG TPA: Uma2 family endonuclease [Meiothermus sp.]|nr:Uma2 family endonuclease [Meiothermus sp.]
MAVAKKLLTAEEFWLLPEHRHAELIQGEMVDRMPTGGVPGDIASEINFILRAWVKETGLGRVGQEAGFVVRQNPDQVRAPNVYFIRNERIPEGGVPQGFWQIAPDLVVEVISPGDTAEAIKEKLEDYFGAGTSEVWLVYPKARQVEACSPSGVTQVFREADILQSPDLLIGFSCKVVAIFQP